MTLSPAARAGAMVALWIVAELAIHAQRDVSVSCLPDKVLAQPGGTGGVPVWVTSGGPPAPQFAARWSATAGRIAGQSASVQWVLGGAPVERRHTATVDVEVNGVSAGSCSLGVWVVERAPSPSANKPGGPGDLRLRGEYITRRAFLRM